MKNTAGVKLGLFLYTSLKAVLTLHSRWFLFKVSLPSSKSIVDEKTLGTGWIWDGSTDDDLALATGVDGTTTTTFSTPAPDVEPNSKIYFLQL